MDIGDIIYIIFYAIVAVIPLSFMISLCCTMCRYIEEAKVKKHSDRISILLKMNKAVEFETVPQRYADYCVGKSKREVETYDFEDHMINLILENEETYTKVINAVEGNQKTYERYIKVAREIESTATKELCASLKIPYHRFIEYETDIFEKNLLKKPEINISIYLKTTYITPAGRNFYLKDIAYDYDDLKVFYKVAMEKKQREIEYQAHVRRKRSKVSDSLRYDVLSRDGYRCSICGASANDGVKLHVDHIYPVSKGGKTEMSNLQTLCVRCYMGKGAKLPKYTTKQI